MSTQDGLKGENCRSASVSSFISLMHPQIINQPIYFSLLSKPVHPARHIPNRFMEWNVKDSSSRLELKSPDSIVFSSDSRPESACIRTVMPIDPSHSIFYWEVSISSSSSSASPIAVGLSVADSPLNRFPGWETGSYGYHGDDGHVFGSAGLGTPYGPTFGAPGDVVGLLVVFSSAKKEKNTAPLASLRFTKNGLLLPIAFNIVWNW